MISTNCRSILHLDLLRPKSQPPKLEFLSKLLCRSSKRLPILFLLIERVKYRLTSKVSRIELLQPRLPEMRH